MKNFTIVSDIFSTPTIHYINKKSNYIVMSPRAKNIAIACGVREENIFLENPFYNKSFETKPSRDELAIFKHELKFAEDLPTISLIGGGASMPKGLKVLQSCLKAKTRLNYVVVCGRNENLKQEIESWLAKQNLDTVKRVKVLGFTSKIKELINISQLIISKAGPAIIFEQLSQGKPPFLYHYIWEQEKGNVEYVTDNKIGIYEPNLNKLASKIDYIISDTKGALEHKAMEDKTKDFILENGISKMVKHILSYEQSDRLQ